MKLEITTRMKNELYFIWINDKYAGCFKRVNNHFEARLLWKASDALEMALHAMFTELRQKEGAAV